MYVNNFSFVENFLRFLSPYNSDFTTKRDFNEDGAVNENTTEGLRLCSVTISPEYAKKWNALEKDFVVLVKNGVLLRNTLYRLGGIGKRPDNKSYFLLLKYKEATHSSEDMEKYKFTHRNYLQGSWCILDKDGNEKVNMSDFKSPCIYGCLYVESNNCYKIETNERICSAHNSMESEKYLFVDNNYDSDKSKRGVLQVNKEDGSIILHPGKTT